MGSHPDPDAGGARLLGLIGLDAVAAAVYRAVLDRPGGTPASLASQCAVTRRRCEQALGQLEALGLVYHAPLRPPRFRATPPEAALNAVLLRRQEELSAAQVEAARLEARFRHALRLETGGADAVELLLGQAATDQRVAQILNAARAEVFALDKPPYATSPGTDVPLELSLLQRGIHVRAIYDTAAFELIPGNLQTVQMLAERGEEARVLADVPLKLLLVDRSIALVPLPTASDDGEMGSLVVHATALVDALRAFFDLLWQRAAPLTSTPPGSADSPLDEVDRQILALLLSGQTDDTISRAIGIGDRTVSRRVGVLAQRAGVRTRFQLGFEASVRGWLNRQP